MALFQWQELKNHRGKMRIPFFKKQVPEAVKEQTNEIKKNYENNKLVYDILNNHLIGVNPVEQRVIQYLNNLNESYK